MVARNNILPKNRAPSFNERLAPAPGTSIMLPTHRIRTRRLMAGLVAIGFGALTLVASRGQSVTNLGGFSVAQGAFPMGLVQGTDGNFYGTSATGAGTGGGSVFEMTPQGLVTILHTFGSFGSSGDGLHPTSGLIQASDGKFYGTTSGAINGAGTVYSITATPGSMTILHFFGPGVGQEQDGTAPMGSLVQGTDGKLYGTTSAGGTAGKGTVFQIGLDRTYSVIHNFGDGSVINDAVAPSVGLVQDAQGNFYGTSYEGGAFGQGAVYKIDTLKRVSILHSFSQSTVVAFGTSASRSGGCHPNSKLLLGADGNLYGTTAAIPGYAFGTLYRITPTGTETVLHYFGDGSVANDGRQLTAPIEGGENLLIQSSNDGTIYGTTSAGGANGKGVLYAMTPTGQVTIVHSFGDSSVNNDGTVPLSGVIFGRDGNLYGTTGEGGTSSWTPNTIATTNAVAPSAAPSAVSSTATSGSSGATTSDVTATFSGATMTITLISGPAVNSGFITITVNSGGTNNGISSGSGTTYSDGGAIPVNPGTYTLGGTAYVGTLFKIQPTIPAFANCMSITGAVGAPVNYPISTSQSSLRIFSSSLPQGLTLDTVTNTIVGTPLHAGVTNVALYSYIPNTTPSVMITGNLVITIFPPPAITSILSEFGTTAAPFYYQVTTNQDAGVYGATGLPAGLSIDASTGLVSGTPSETGTSAVDLSYSQFGLTTHSTLHLVITAAAPVLSQTYVPIYSFQSGSWGGDGIYPVGLAPGPNSTLIGITSSGVGIPSEQELLSPAGTVNHVCELGGATPSSFIVGLDGNYYGLLPNGGNAGLGALMEVTSDGDISYVHSFGDGTVRNDGTNPIGALLQTSDGRFYGVTKYGGNYNLGTIYSTRADHTVFVVYSFTAADGIPSSGLMLGTDSAMYGTTLTGGAFGGGTVYRLDLTTGVRTILYSFGASANDGQIPSSELVAHGAKIYGTTKIGGTLGRGTVFALTTTGAETILHNFGDGSVTGDGINPIGTIVVVDRPTTGVTLFGTTQNGGANGAGAVYELDANQTLTILHSFDDPNTVNDGVLPLGGLCLGADGNLYGTTVAGGAGLGTFFAVVANLNAAPTFGGTPLWTMTGSLPVGLIFDNTTGAIHGTPVAGAATGVYRISVTSPTQVTTTTTYALGQSFSEWAMAKTGTHLVTNAPTKDGVPNALKYLFDINPTGSMSPTDRSALPTLGVDTGTIPGTPYLSLTFRQNAALAKMAVSLESSSDLVSWTAVDATDMILQQVGTDSVTGDPVMEMGAPMDASARQFLRLKVTPQ